VEFKFELIKKGKNRWDQEEKIYCSPNKFFELKVVENRSYYFNSKDVNGFNFGINGRLQEIDKKNIISKLESKISDWDMNIVDQYNQELIKYLFNYKQTVEDRKESFLETKSNKKREDDLKISKIKSSIYEELDKDNNGLIDVIENNHFNKLLRKKQKQIIEIDKNYINDFVKISNYLKTKRENLQTTFSTLKKSKTKTNLNQNLRLLKNQIHTYNLVLYYSLTMINSLTESDLITFNEIYEKFDTLKIFKTDHEKEVSEKLDNIKKGLDSVVVSLNNLMISINQMELNIISSLEELNYTMEEGFTELNHSLSSELQSINSSINVNNLISSIQTYQLYKINKNTKSLR